MSPWSNGCAPQLQGLGRRVTTARVHRKSAKPRAFVFFPNSPTLCVVFVQTLVSWTHQRWVWHVEILDENSHDVFYDDLKVRSSGYG